MKITKIILLAILVTATVFAQEGKGPKIRFSGDVNLNLILEAENEWHQITDFNDMGMQFTLTVDDKRSAFNVPFGWNVLFGLDFGESVSLDFRLSNPAGYALDQLNFTNGSGMHDQYDIDLYNGTAAAKAYFPALPNAYFTWKPGSVFSLKGGLLEVEGNTTLDLVAGVETESGLWTSHDSWADSYNNSQGGIKFGFELGDNVEIGLTTALVSPTNVLDEETPNSQIHNEFRFIIDADIAIGDVATISPTFQTRSHWRERTYTEQFGLGDPIQKKETPIMVAYGVDAGFEFNDMFSLDAGIALGHINLGKPNKVDTQDNGEKVNGFGFLARVAPTLFIGRFIELEFSYSLGTGSLTQEAYSNSLKELTEKTTLVYNDLYLRALFNASDNFAIGPSVELAVRGDKFTETGINVTAQPDLGSGYRYFGFGINTVVRF